MSDLIDRKALLYHLDLCLAESDGNTPITDAVIVAIKCAVEQMPAVDAEPVRHGHWIFGESFMLGEHRKCSVCDCMIPIRQSWDMKYCPDCGAKMDEVSE